MFIRPMQTGIIQASGGGAGFASDPHYANTKFWFDARMGLIDNSPSAHTVNESGTGSIVGNAYYDNGGSGVLYSPVSSDFRLTGDFTIEISANLQSKFTFASVGSNWLVFYSYNIYFEYFGHDNYTDSWGTGTPTHILMTRSGSTVRVFQDGSLIKSGTKSGTLTPSNQAFFLGGQGGASNQSDWYLYAGRFIDGVATQTSNFTPPSGNYLGV